MDSRILSKEVTISEIGQIAKIKIYPEAQEAINKHWESLLFSTNETTFATVEIDDYIFSLETIGEVKILSMNTDEVYTNKDVKKITEIIENGQLEGSIIISNEPKKYSVSNNNWFSVIIRKIVKREGDVIESESIDDKIFEPCLKNIEDLEKRLIQFAIYLYSNTIN